MLKTVPEIEFKLGKVDDPAIEDIQLELASIVKRSRNTSEKSIPTENEEQGSSDAELIEMLRDLEIQEREKIEVDLSDLPFE